MPVDAVDAESDAVGVNASSKVVGHRFIAVAVVAVIETQIDVGVGIETGEIRQKNHGRSAGFTGIVHPHVVSAGMNRSVLVCHLNPCTTAGRRRPIGSEAARFKTIDEREDCRRRSHRFDEFQKCHFVLTVVEWIPCNIGDARATG